MVDTTCPDCGTATVSYYARPRLCDDCARERARQRIRAFKVANREKIRAAARIVIERDMTCQDCGAGFVRTGNRGPIPKWCADCSGRRQNASDAAYRRRNPEKVLTWIRRNSALRRAAARVQSEQVERLVVFERDGWTCQLCHQPVIRGAFRWPAPWSPSLDHVQPLSLGGEHTYANTQLAHLRCNLRKTNKVVA